MPFHSGTTKVLCLVLGLALAGCTGGADAVECGETERKTANVDSPQRRDMEGTPLLQLSLDVPDVCPSQVAFVRANVFVGDNETCPGNAIVLVHSTAAPDPHDVYASRESGGMRFESRSPWTFNGSQPRAVGWVMDIRLPEPPTPELLSCVLARVDVQEFSISYKPTR